MASKLRGRRIRRQAKMVRRSRGKFRIGHASKGGRTGSVHSKKPKPTT